MGTPIETFRAVVYPWHCDHQNHMTVMHYVGMFDAAFWHHVAKFGFDPEFLNSNQRGFADVRDVLEYKAELSVGSLVVIKSSLTRIGGSSFTALHEMYNDSTGTLAATSEKTSAYFNLELRGAEKLPENQRAIMEAMLK